MPGKFLRLFFHPDINVYFINLKLKRVSYYQMSVDDGPFFKQKSSGIIICTGINK